MNNSQVAQAFAKGAIKGTGSNMFIDGQTIYSYGYHFPIARHIGAKVVLFNANGYSNSTAKHKNHVSSALAYFTVIQCPDCAIEKAEDYLREQIKDATAKSKRARSQWAIDSWLRQIVNYKLQLQALKKLQKGA